MTKVVNDRLSSAIESAILLNMATIEPDLEISGLTSMDDIIALFEDGTTELYSAERVAKIIHAIVVGLLENM